MPFSLVGALGGLALVLIATFGRKQDKPGDRADATPCSRACSSARSRSSSPTSYVSGASAGALIRQAILGTLGVFVGMLVVYKTGAIRVTPKFTRMLVAGHLRRRWC